MNWAFDLSKLSAFLGISKRPVVPGRSHDLHSEKVRDRKEWRDLHR